MTQSKVTESLAEFGEDMLWHLTRIAQGSIDLVTLALVGVLIYLTTINAAEAGMHGRPLFAVQARIEGTAGVAVASSHAPTSCGLNNDLLASAHRSCTHALLLEPADI